MPLKPHIQRYLDATKARRDRRFRYHVVRSSPDRRVQFAKWAKSASDRWDVLLDFSTREPVRICLTHDAIINAGRHGGRLGWRFSDTHGRTVPCASSYETLFVAYLKWNRLPFEYQKWMFMRTSHVGRKEKERARKMWLRSEREDISDDQIRTYYAERRDGGFRYFPDFYLPATDEFIEIKGWPVHPRQSRAIRCLKRLGYCIHVLEWKHLRKLLGLPFLSYPPCLYRAKKDAIDPARAFANPDWVKERLGAVPKLTDLRFVSGSPR